MKKVLLVTIMLFFVICFSAQTKINQVKYLEKIPQIDGKPDQLNNELTFQSFNSDWKSNSTNPNSNAKYQIGYNLTNLYLYVEYEASEIIMRDRGWQNGDGLIMVIAKPQINNEPTDEFYVMGFSPQTLVERSWQQKTFWYKNIDLYFRQIGDNVKFAWSQNNGKVGFELLIPWEQLPPYNPFISSQIGFNLAFVQAIGATESNYNYVLEDAKMGSEQRKRIYVNLEFEKPKNSNTDLSFFSLSKNTLNFDENIEINTVLSNLATTSINYEITDKQNKIIKSDSFRLITKSFVISKHTLKIDDLGPGEYKLKLSSGENSQLINFVKLPEFAINNLEKGIENLKDKITAGSFNSIKYKLEEVKEAYSKLKYYDADNLLFTQVNYIINYIDEAAKGSDLIQKQKGVFRRAHLSKYDNTLQPYSISIPTDYNSEKKYILMVYLHGSGQDDRGNLERLNFPGLDIIAVAPFGRGTSNCYAVPESQADIKEVIQDVMINYSIDEKNIILAGFSMGGYGVYRTFYDFEDIFKGLVIIAGPPLLAQKWNIKGTHPDFKDKKVLQKFSKIPMFVFHGSKDRNVPFEEAKEVVDKISKINPDLMFVTADVGHTGMGKENYVKFINWIKELTQK